MCGQFKIWEVVQKEASLLLQSQQFSPEWQLLTTKQYNSILFSKSYPVLKGMVLMDAPVVDTLRLPICI